VTSKSNIRPAAERPRAVGTVLRFLCVGLANTAVGYSVIMLSLRLGAGDYAANATGYLVGLAMSYQLNRRWTFAATSSASKREAVRFGGAVLTAYGANVGVLYFARSLGYVDSPIGQAAAQIAYSVTFFLLARFLVFVEARAPDGDQCAEV
jgi:putative flippase GtrA